MDREFLTGPPLTLHLPVPPLFLAFWAACRESLLAGPMDRVVREVIAATVSIVNECPYCIDSHVASTSALGEDAAAKALRSGRVETLERDDLLAAARWAAATRSPGDPPAKIPAVIDRRPFMTRMLAVFPGRLLGVSNLEPGASSQFIPAAPKVSELAWLDAAPEIAAAWSALVASAEAAGEQVLSATSRRTVGGAISRWDGADLGLGSTFIPDVVASLPDDERPAARFALTVALAAYRVDRDLADAVRPTHPTDADLISIAAWASMRATLRIATWI